MCWCEYGGRQHNLERKERARESTATAFLSLGILKIKYLILALPLSPGTLSSARDSWTPQDGPLLMRSREGAATMPLREIVHGKNLL